MQIHTTCRQTRMTPALKRVLEERLAKLERFTAVREAHVVLIAEKYRQIAEIVLKTKGKEFVCREESRDMAASIEGSTEPSGPPGVGSATSAIPSAMAPPAEFPSAAMRVVSIA